MSRRSLSQRLTRWFAASLLLASVIAAPAAGAVPGQYSVDLCPEDKAAPSVDGVVVPMSRTSAVDNCGVGGGLELTVHDQTTGQAHAMSMSTNGQIAGATVAATAAGPHVRVALARAFVTFTGLSSTSNYPSSFGVQGDYSWYPWLEFKNLQPLPNGVGTYSQAFPDAGATLVSWRVMCDHQCTSPAGGVDMKISDVYLELVETTPPLPATFEPVGLLDGTEQGGYRQITVNAADEDSGVQSVQVWSGGRQLASSPYQPCSQVQIVPCPRRPQITVLFDASSIATGTNTVDVVTVDAAGNTSKTTTPTFKLVGSASKAATPSPTPTVSSTAAPLTVAFTNAPAKPLPAGKVRWIEGRVLNPAGGSVPADTRLELTEQVDAVGGTTAPATKAALSADGRFRYRIQPWSSTLLTATAKRGGATVGTAQAHVKVSAKLSLSARSLPLTSSGHPYELSGTVGLIPRPAGGARVAIQVKNGKGWMDVHVARTDKLGRFKWRYTFKRHTHYTFRAKLIVTSDVASAPSTSPLLRLAP